MAAHEESRIGAERLAKERERSDVAEEKAEEQRKKNRIFEVKEVPGKSRWSHEGVAK